MVEGAEGRRGSGRRRALASISTLPLTLYLPTCCRCTLVCMSPSGVAAVGLLTPEQRAGLNGA